MLSDRSENGNITLIIVVVMIIMILRGNYYTYSIFFFSKVASTIATYGFCGVILTTEDLAQNYEDKIQTDLIVLDFSKAFDVVPHQRLLHKLDHYGIRGPTLLWIQNFLTTRTQKVVVDGSFSDTAHVGSGVPQGTVLGPILFLCYINDLPSSVSSDVRLFADDCLLYRPIKSKDNQKKLQEDSTKLERWADIWGMKFNPSKCSVLRVKRPRAKEIASDYQFKGVTLGQVTNSPYLGVSISENQFKGMSLKIKRDCIFFNGSVTFGILLSCMGSIQARGHR